MKLLSIPMYENYEPLRLNLLMPQEKHMYEGVVAPRMVEGFQFQEIYARVFGTVATQARSRDFEAS